MRTLDPQLPFELVRPYDGLLAENGHSSGQVGQQPLSAILVVCTSELREFRTEMAIGSAPRPTPQKARPQLLPWDVQAHRPAHLPLRSQFGGYYSTE
ncbi:hypothetical protein OKW29_000558 [Paraburkholderia sp. CI3]